MKKSAEHAEHPGLTALRKILRGTRDDEQGGYHDVGPDGKFAGHATFFSMPIGFATPEQLDVIFSLAGISPDPVIAKGSCEECVFSEPQKDGSVRDLGWNRPCVSCRRPKMSSFVPLASVKNSALRLTDDEATLLTNARENLWWATGLVVVTDLSKRSEQEFDRCSRIEARLLRRNMVVSSGGRRCLTNKGAKALALYKEKSRKKGRAA
jgi:hypothetical protein